MTHKQNIIAGLDIGTSNITVVIADVEQEPGKHGVINVVGVGSSPSRGLRKGVVINIEATVSSISEAVSQAETMAGVEISSVFATISGSHIQGFNSHGIVGVRDKEVSLFDIEKVIEAAKAVAIPLDREIIHVLPQEFIIDEQDGIKEPLGISGVRLEARVHIITGSVASAQNVVKCANRCGLGVHDIVVAPLAASRIAVSPEEQELGVALIDIGGGTCDLTVFHQGAVKHTSVISVGGNHITNDIAAGLRTPIAAAEDIKCKFGTAQASLVNSGETVEVPSTGGRPPRVLSKSVLADIIEPRIQEIFALVQRELVKSGSDELLTSGIVLTGGTANLRGIEPLAQHVFGLPVRVGRPGTVKGLSDLVSGPEHSCAVGLIDYGSEVLQQARVRGGRSRIGSTFKRVGNWIAEHF